VRKPGSKRQQNGLTAGETAPNIMKIFHFTADIVFSAENIDAALDKLRQHFAYLADRETDFISPLDMTGELKLEPVDDQ